MQLLNISSEVISYFTYLFYVKVFILMNISYFKL